MQWFTSRSKKIECIMNIISPKRWIESVCMSSKGTKFHIVGAAKENERCPNVVVRSLGIDRILLSEEECKFLLGV